MIDSSTLKALGSTLLTFAVVLAVGTFTSAIGQDTAPRATAPTANPYETVESGGASATHNHPSHAAPNAGATHNTP
ncbi:MAG: hypothetical protein ABEL51_15405 [Salinibacter sp.]